MPYLKTDSETSSLEATTADDCQHQHQQHKQASTTATRTNNAFDKLVAELSAALGPSSGLDSDDVDPRDIQRLMEEYTSDESEWSSYAFSDSSRGYTRNLVDEGNGKSNLVSIFFLYDEIQGRHADRHHTGTSSSSSGPPAKEVPFTIMQTLIAS